MNGKTRKKKAIYKVEIMACIAAIIALIMIITLNMTKPKAEKTIEPTESIKSETETVQIIANHFESEVPETEKKQKKYYELTETERALIEQVVAAEACGEPFKGQLAVAQCILTACKRDNIRPAQAIKKYGYTTAYATPTDNVKEAVAAVFDLGDGATDEPIIFFYAPARTTSEWHESQIFVIEIGNHRFFKEAE